MIDIVKKFFSKNSNEASTAQPKDTTHDIRIATCALLLEMSYIDGEFSDTEKEHIISMMKEANLDPDHWQDLQSTVEKKLYAGTKTVWK